MFFYCKNILVDIFVFPSGQGLSQGWANGGISPPNKKSFCCSPRESLENAPSKYWVPLLTMWSGYGFASDFCITRLSEEFTREKVKYTAQLAIKQSFLNSNPATFKDSSCALFIVIEKQSLMGNCSGLN